MVMPARRDAASEDPQIGRTPPRHASGAAGIDVHDAGGGSYVRGRPLNFCDGLTHVSRSGGDWKIGRYGVDALRLIRSVLRDDKRACGAYEDSTYRLYDLSLSYTSSARSKRASTTGS